MLIRCALHRAFPSSRSFSQLHFHAGATFDNSTSRNAPARRWQDIRQQIARNGHILVAALGVSPTSGSGADEDWYLQDKANATGSRKESAANPSPATYPPSTCTKHPQPRQMQNHIPAPKRRSPPLPSSRRAQKYSPHIGVTRCLMLKLPAHVHTMNTTAL